MSRGQDFDFLDEVDSIQQTQIPESAVDALSSPSSNNNNFDYTDPDFELSDLSDTQEKLLSIFLVCSAVLSLIGSITIVFKILRSLCKNQTTTPYDRIILGLSCCDIVASCTYALGPFLLPRETSQRVWAVGDESSCQKLGFLMQLSCLWAVWYNAMLSFYYLLTVRFQVKRKDFCRKYEPWMHLSGAIFFPTTALMGYIGNWYDEEALAMTCWIGDVKTGCDEFGNCSGDWGELVAYIIGALPTVITILAVMINNTIIYVFVRKSLMKQNRILMATDSESNHNNNNNNNNDDGSSKNESQESSINAERHAIQNRLSNEAAIQGFLYVSTFLVTILPAFAIQILDGSMGYGESDQGRIYPLLVLNSILLPLQGFFNVFIYVRPSYSRFSAANPDQASWSILKQALFDPNIPRMSSTTGNSSEPTSAAGDKNKHNSNNNKQNNKIKCGSNFSMSLDNIVEEEDDSVADANAAETPDSTAESMSNELHPPFDAR